MSPENDAEICRKYPMLYAQRFLDMRATCMCWGFECGDGWKDLIDRMSAKLEAINEKLPPKDIEKGDFKIEASQIKEKYGSLRAYMGPTMDSVFDEVDKIIGEAEKESSKTCETCGEPGRIVSHHGWLSCCCKKHTPTDAS